MLKVCGVTYDHSTNYGTCLQACALKYMIENTVVGDGERCSYDVLPMEKFKSTPYFKAPKLSALSKVKRFSVEKMKAYRRKTFVPFEKKHLSYVDCSDIKKKTDLNRKYDAFVCGSDVVWNFNFTHGDSAYLLDFAADDKYKFSYAASFGKAVSGFQEENQILTVPAEDIYRQYMSRLDAVGVREREGVEVASRFTDKKVEFVCDPTMLLKAEDWMKFETKVPTNGKYIFAYNTTSKPTYLGFLKRLSEQTGLPVVQVTWLFNDAVKQRAFTYPSPDKWLYLLRNAEYVVTGSFHATVFSLLFHRKLFSVVTGEKNERGNLRMLDLLSNLGLEDRMFCEVPQTIDLSEVNYDTADRKLQQIREDSYAYLKRNLENAYLLKQKA